MVERVDIQELKDSYVICRALGHSWEDNPTGQISPTRALGCVGVILLRCTRCTTERNDYIGSDLRVADREYVYPPLYTSIPGQGTRPNLRGELLRRSLLIRSYGQKNVSSIGTRSSAIVKKKVKE